VAALALSRILQRVVSQPILRLAETARHVSRDKDYSVRAQATGDRDEVALLVDAFNGMLVEIHKRDRALQESEQQFRTLADSIPETIEEVRSEWRASLATGKPFEMIFPLRGADGTFRQFLTLAMPVRDAEGNVVRWFGTNTDITEQRRSEEALRQTEKLAATGRLAASIAHEINNPLEAVTNLVYLARRQPLNVEKYLKLADQELDRIAQITKNTLGFYRDSTSPAEVDISTILEEVLSLYARRIHFKRITLRPDYGNGLKVMGYPGEIRQIFANLIANAIEALSEEGFLAIRASRARMPNGGGLPGVRVTFLDNGSGIAPAPEEHF
jgi:signal transduction histidine kinase